MLAAEEKVTGLDFKTILPKLSAPGMIVIYRVIFKSQVQTSRRLLASATKVSVAPSDLTTHVIYVKPDAVFGIFLGIFIFFVAYVGFMCLYGVNTPKGFASKPFKFGREL